MLGALNCERNSPDANVADILHAAQELEEQGAKAAETSLAARQRDAGCRMSTHCWVRTSASIPKPGIEKPLAQISKLAR